MTNLSRKPASIAGHVIDTSAFRRPPRRPLRIERGPRLARSHPAGTFRTKSTEHHESEAVEIPPNDRPRDWTWGLKTRTANALRGYGYTSREAVAAVSERRLLAMTSFGRGSLDDLRRWLGRIPSTGGD
jgi:hypothetical protein